jgi:hypothetical protein
VRVAFILLPRHSDLRRFGTWQWRLALALALLSGVPAPASVSFQMDPHRCLPAFSCGLESLPIASRWAHECAEFACTTNYAALFTCRCVATAAAQICAEGRAGPRWRRRSLHDGRAGRTRRRQCLKRRETVVVSDASLMPHCSRSPSAWPAAAKGNAVVQVPMPQEGQRHMVAWWSAARFCECFEVSGVGATAARMRPTAHKKSIQSTYKYICVIHALTQGVVDPSQWPFGLAPRIQLNLQHIIRSYHREVRCYLDPCEFNSCSSWRASAPSQVLDLESQNQPRRRRIQPRDQRERPRNALRMIVHVTTRHLQRWIQRAQAAARAPREPTPKWSENGPSSFTAWRRC